MAHMANLRAIHDSDSDFNPNIFFAITAVSKDMHAKDNKYAFIGRLKTCLDCFDAKESNFHVFATDSENITGGRNLPKEDYSIPLKVRPRRLSCDIFKNSAEFSSVIEGYCQKFPETEVKSLLENLKKSVEEFYSTYGGIPYFRGQQLAWILENGLISLEKRLEEPWKKTDEALQKLEEDLKRIKNRKGPKPNVRIPLFNFNAINRSDFDCARELNESILAELVEKAVEATQKELKDYWKACADEWGGNPKPNPDHIEKLTENFYPALLTKANEHKKMLDNNRCFKNLHFTHRRSWMLERLECSATQLLYKEVLEMDVPWTKRDEFLFESLKSFQGNLKGKLNALRSIIEVVRQEKHKQVCSQVA